MPNWITSGTKVIWIGTESYKALVFEGVLQSYSSDGALMGSGVTQHYSGGMKANVLFNGNNIRLCINSLRKDTPKNREKMEIEAKRMTAARIQRLKDNGYWEKYYQSKSEQNEQL